jgi:hypothetical protein
LKQRAEKELGQVMSTLRTTAAFPALREVEHPCCSWPTAEYVTTKFRIAVDVLKQLL